ncbi:MAG: transglutaminase family protein [Acidimicrobiales bacterium]
MDPVDRLAAIYGGERLALDEVLLLVAAARPRARVDVAGGLGMLDRLAETCREPTLDGLIRHLFRDAGFRGDTGDYHDVRNSLLDQVLGRRLGMPITLGVVLLEVGRRIGVPADGVGLPGHFLVRDRVLPGVFVDPFTSGELLDADGARRRFHAVYGPAAVFDPAWLDPVPPTAIVSRVLNNLALTFRRRAPQELDWLLDLRLSIPESPSERRGLAELCVVRGRFGDAARLLESGPDPDHPDQARARALRARLN